MQQQSDLVHSGTENLLELSNETANGTANASLAGALRRLGERAKTLHNSHYTKHSSYSTKHSSW